MTKVQISSFNSIRFYILFASGGFNLYNGLFLQQNIVVKVAMFDDKKTRKALKIVVGVSSKIFDPMYLSIVP